MENVAGFKHPRSVFLSSSIFCPQSYTGSPDPLQVWLIKLFHSALKTLSVDRQYMAAYHTRPLTRGQFRALLPDAEIVSERLVFPKSYVATW